MKKETTETSSSASAAQKKQSKGAKVKLEKKQKSTAKKSRGGKNYTPKGEGHGGERDHAGRKTKAERLEMLGVSDTLEAHLVQEVELEAGMLPKLPEGSKPIRSKKPRLVAILDMLADEALGDKRSIPAATEYLNRTLGRAKQTVEIGGSIKTEEQKLPSKAALAGAMAYEDALEAEDDE